MRTDADCTDAVCFVCLGEAGDDPLCRPCACSTCVHASCFEEMVRRVPAHATRCPVCLQVYDTCVVGTFYNLSCNVRMLMICTSLGCMTGLVCIGIGACLLQLDTDYRASIIVATSSVAATLLSIMYSHVLAGMGCTIEPVVVFHVEEVRGARQVYAFRHLRTRTRVTCSADEWALWRFVGRRVDPSYATPPRVLRDEPAADADALRRRDPTDPALLARTQHADDPRGEGLGALGYAAAV